MTSRATADTTGGLVAGRVIGASPGSSVVAFQGIPYGAPPVGGRRWRAAEPARPWKETLLATAPGPAAPQPAGDAITSVVPGMHPARTDEDCLSLNVWAPVDARPGDDRAVMVWVHGGAFTIGASSLSTYDPTRLVAEHGVVFVAPNYRLGALGFLALPAGRERGVLPNVGLTDVLLALRWVGQNARAFGGDPGRVTVFGESAGAGAILHLLGAPGAEGLFRRAILQSPGVAQTLDAGQGALAAADLLGRLGIDPDAADVGERLRAVDPVRLLDAQSASVAALSTTLGAMPFHPVVDGELVRDMPLEVLGSGAARDVELVVGTTADEMRLFSSPALAQLDRQRLVRVLQPVVARAVGRDIGADSVDLLVKQYETWLGDDGGADRVWAAVMTDGLMRLPAEAAVTAHAAHQDGVYTYSFAWQPRGPAAHLGAFHAIDLPFTFGTFDREGWGEMLGADAAAHDVSRAMRSAWAAFAAGGDPGPGLAGGWPRWDDDRRTTLVLGDPVTLVEDPLAERRQAWEALGHG